MKKIFASFMAVTAGFSLFAGTTAPLAGKVVAKFNFEGPYIKQGKNDRIQKGFTNNYRWGKKDILIVPDKGIEGNSQKIDIRGISSGELQFFSPAWRMWRGKYYRVSFFAKGEGFGGKVSCMVRKIPGPWTTYMKGISFLPTEKWTKYSFLEEAKHDIDNSFGILFSTGSIGRLWIDNIQVEEFDIPPEQILCNRNKVVEGNLIPRSSYEGTTDYFWTNGIHSKRSKPWYGEWLDPRIYRAKNGKFGTYCMGIPVPAESGAVFVSSYPILVAAKECYTFSVYLRTDKKNRRVNLSVKHPRGQVIGAKTVTVTDQWQRFSVTTKPIPPEYSEVLLWLSQGSEKEDYRIYADGFQFEHGNKAGDYKPAYPYEITMGLAGNKLNIVKWGEPLPLEIHTGSAVSGTGGKAFTALLRVTGYPDYKVFEQKMELQPGSVKRIEIAPKRNGLCRIEVIPERKKLAFPAEMLAGRLPEPRKTGMESLFGSHITVRPYFLAYAKAIGIKWNRLHDASGITKWFGVEPEKGKIQWADEQVDAMVREGFHILGLPDYPPKWAQAKDSTQQYVDPQAFREHCRRLAEHYKGRIDYWEIWNEPYIRYFFPRPVGEFAKVFESGAKGIRSGNPNATILGFCTEINGFGYASGIPADIRKYADIISFHCYFQNVTGDGTVAFDKDVEAYQKFMGNVPPKEYWNTEGAYGAVGKNSFYSFMEDKAVNEQAVAFGARVWQEQRKAGISKVFIYTMHQSDTIQYTGGNKKLIGFDRSLTPSAASTAVTAWCIDGLSPIKIEKIRGIVQSLFSNGKRHVWSVFNDAAVAGTRFLDLNKIPSDYTVLDPMGNDPRKDGLMRWKIGTSPLFIMTDQDNALRFHAECMKSLPR